jgi:hypothetical protein
VFADQLNPLHQTMCFDTGQSGRLQASAACGITAGTFSLQLQQVRRAILDSSTCLVILGAASEVSEIGDFPTVAVVNQELTDLHDGIGNCANSDMFYAAGDFHPESL